ncbi:hypothetical protein PS691_02657 [Pseudomonas fluorescens]|uniref:HNH nuclease domain-containing protein n=2 Tax=Pseudomonas fluorescens TaxID=294 RepID=A0A5E7C9F6_PSEFL|nr:hypothetical protein PS691_02657 [Pseudomonas fluorescens]
MSIFIPVSSRSPGKEARAFLPFNGMEGAYTHGFKAEPTTSKYLNALAAIQRGYLSDETKTFLTRKGPENQRCDKWRHGNQTGSPLLGPTLGWVEIPFEFLSTATHEELTSERERSGITITSSVRSNAHSEGVLFRQVAAESRTFQLAFRIGALKLWGPACALSGASCLLEAAHIKGVATCKLSDPKAITDPFNSIILNISFHALLDEGLISFTDEGNLLISDELSKKDCDVYGVNTQLKASFHPNAVKYLQYHRRNLFRGATSHFLR